MSSSLISAVSATFQLSKRSASVDNNSTVSTSLKFHLLSEVQENNNAGLQNFVPEILRDSANEKNLNTFRSP